MAALKLLERALTKALGISRLFLSNKQNRLSSWKHAGPGSVLASRMRGATDVALTDSVWLSSRKPILYVLRKCKLACFDVRHTREESFDVLDAALTIQGLFVSLRITLKKLCTLNE